MLTALDTAPVAKLEDPLPPEVIVIYPDRENALLHVKPRGVLEAAPRNEIMQLLPLWHGIGVRDMVKAAAEICVRHGWVIIDHGIAGQVKDGPAAGKYDIAVYLQKQKGK